MRRGRGKQRPYKWGRKQPQRGRYKNVEALKFHLEGLRERGRPVPGVTEIEIKELIAA